MGTTANPVSGLKTGPYALRTQSRNAPRSAAASSLPGLNKSGSECSLSVREVMVASYA